MAIPALQFIQNQNYIFFLLGFTICTLNLHWTLICDFNLTFVLLFRQYLKLCIFLVVVLDLHFKFWLSDAFLPIFYAFQHIFNCNKLYVPHLSSTYFTIIRSVTCIPEAHSDAYGWGCWSLYKQDKKAQQFSWILVPDST